MKHLEYAPENFKDERILVVDDDPQNPVAKMLRDFGYRCVVESVRVDIRTIYESTSKPDLIVMSLPVSSDEFSLGPLKEIRALDRDIDTVPILIVDGLDDATRVDAYASGAADFISKPVNRVHLRCRVRNLLRISERQRESSSNLRKLRQIIDGAELEADPGD